MGTDDKGTSRSGYRCHCSFYSELSMKTVLMLVEELKAKGYFVPMRMRLLLENSRLGTDGKPLGDGANVRIEMEIDRVNVFKALLGDKWLPELQIAHELVEEEKMPDTIELLLRELVK